MADSIQADYLQAHQEIVNWVNNLKYNKATQEKMQHALNLFYRKENSGTIDSGYLTSEDMEEIIKYTEKVVDAGVNRATLNAAPGQILSLIHI